MWLPKLPDGKDACHGVFAKCRRQRGLREKGLVAALKYPSGKPLAPVFTLVDPSKSAEETKRAPWLALL